MVTKEAIEARIRDGVPDAEVVEVVDLTGTQDHYELTVVAKSFDGTSPVDRQRRIYAVLGDWMSGPIHALALRTLTPDAWSRVGKRLT